MQRLQNCMTRIFEFNLPSTGVRVVLGAGLSEPVDKKDIAALEKGEAFQAYLATGRLKVIEGDKDAGVLADKSGDAVKPAHLEEKDDRIELTSKTENVEVKAMDAPAGGKK